MASATVNPTFSSHSLKDVIVSGLCDSCGTRAAHVAVKDKLKLSFCAHHARHNAASLLERGFAITPDTYRFNN